MRGDKEAFLSSPIHAIRGAFLHSKVLALRFQRSRLMLIRGPSLFGALFGCEPPLQVSFQAKTRA